MPPRPGRPASGQAQLISAIETGLADGHLQPGQHLPTVRELASRYGCDPGTVVRASRILLHRGLVRREGNATRSRLVLCESPRPLLAGAIALITDHRAGVLPPEPGWSVHEFAGAMEAATARGHTVLVVDPTEAAVRLRAWRDSGLLGVIALGERLGAVQDSLADSGLPVAATAHVCPGLVCDRAGSDHEAGGHLLAAHLIAQGRRRLASLWGWSSDDHPDQRAWARDRQTGISRACAEAGLAPPRRRVWTGSDDRETAVRAAIVQLAELLTGPEAPDALLAHTDGAVPVIIAAVRHHGGSVHERIAVAGYDHYWRPDLGEPPCASIDKRNAEVGAALVELLLERAAGRAQAMPVTRLIQPRLVAS